MAVFKQGPRPEEDFTMISNALARNPEITIEAKGIYMFMRSHRDGWNMTVVRIAEALGASKGRVSKYINELIDAGYIIRSQGSGEGGRFGEIEYLILTSPRPKNPDTVKPYTENRPTKEDYLPKKINPQEDQEPQGAVAPAAGAASPSKDSKTEEHPLPQGWQPDNKLWARMRKKHPTLDLHAETQKFCDYWHAQAGARSRKKDWARSWQNWLNKASTPPKYTPKWQLASNYAEQSLAQLRNEGKINNDPLPF